MYFPADFNHPQTHSEVGAVLFNDVLYSLHRRTISSAILHTHSGEKNFLSFFGAKNKLELSQAGILVGLGAAPMWASKATYLTQLGQVYAKLTDQAVEAIIVRFFGFFFLGKFEQKF